MRTSFLSLLSVLVPIAIATLVPEGLPLAESKPPLQHISGRPAQPSRAASFVVQNGRTIRTSEWTPLSRATPREFYHVAAFDAAEHENVNGVLGAPTDNDPGCTASVPPGQRWFFGPSYNNPFVSADLRTGPNGAGADCEALSLSWHIDVGDAEPDVDKDGLPDSDFFVAIGTFEELDVAGCTNDGSGFINGMVYDFSGMPWNPDEFSYMNVSLNGTGFAHTMPADGVGGYQIILAIAYDPVAGTLTLPTGVDPSTQLGVSAQVMLWGTGDNETIFDARRGHDIDGQYDDDAPTDGVHDLALECYSYLFGVCPDPLCASVAFWMKDDPTACECDLDGNRVVDTADLSIFLANFGAVSPNIPNPAADFNADGIVEISDLSLFLSCFAYVCP